MLEPVNSAFRIFKTDGHSLIGPTNVNDLFDLGSTQFTSDPRCYYDPTTNTATVVHNTEFPATPMLAVNRQAKMYRAPNT